MTLPRHSIAILGGGPGGYEAALVAAQLGADVTVVDSDGLGGSCVLTDCVPSKTLIETSNAMTLLNRSAGLGIATGGLATVNAARLYQRITDLARAQSADITARLAAEGIKVIRATNMAAFAAFEIVMEFSPFQCESFGFARQESLMRCGRCEYPQVN